MEVNMCNANLIGNNAKMQQLIKRWCKLSIQIKKWSWVLYEGLWNFSISSRQWVEREWKTDK